MIDHIASKYADLSVFFFQASHTLSRKKKTFQKSAHYCTLYIYKVVVHRHFQCKQASNLSKLGKVRHVHMYVWPHPLIYLMGIKHYGFPIDVLIEGVNHRKCTFMASLYKHMEN